jgi:hypothetical protein
MQLKWTLGDKAETSTSCRAHAGWLSLWDAPVPGKVEVHFWRLIENGLAVGAELQRRNIKRGSGVLHVIERRTCCTGSGLTCTRPWLGKNSVCLLAVLSDHQTGSVFTASFDGGSSTGSVEVRRRIPQQ